MRKPEVAEKWLGSYVGRVTASTEGGRLSAGRPEGLRDVPDVMLGAHPATAHAWPQWPLSNDLSLVGGNPAIMLDRVYVERGSTHWQAPLRQSASDFGPVLLGDDGLWHNDVNAKLVAHFDRRCDDKAAPREPILEAGDGLPLLKRGAEQPAQPLGVE